MAALLVAIVVALLALGGGLLTAFFGLVVSGHQSGARGMVIGGLALAAFGIIVIVLGIGDFLS